MRSLYSQDRARDDSVCALLHVPEGRDLWEEVLEVPADTGVLVRPDEGDILVRKNARVLFGKRGYDGSAHASVAHADIGVDEDEGVGGGEVGRGGCRGDDECPAALSHVQTGVGLGKRGISLHGRGRLDFELYMIADNRGSGGNWPVLACCMHIPPHDS